MKDEPQEPLEQFIDDALKRLPDLKAPPDLLRKVMAQTALQPVAWWQSGWSCWPLAVQFVVALTIACLAALFLREVSVLWSGESISVLLARAGGLLSGLSSLARTFAIVTRPFKTYLLLPMITLCLVIPFIVGGLRTVWSFTLNEEIPNEN